MRQKGPLGAFCRTYSITEAIAKFLPDVYTPTAKEDRYTYAAGSTAAGLVIYDGDVFAYSNHSTDPAGAGSATPSTWSASTSSDIWMRARRT